MKFYKKGQYWRCAKCRAEMRRLLDMLAHKCEKEAEK